MVDSMSLMNNKNDPVMNPSNYRSSAPPRQPPPLCSDSSNRSLANTTSQPQLIHNGTVGCNSSSATSFYSSGHMGGDYATMFMVFFIIAMYCLFAGYACFHQSQPSPARHRNDEAGTGGHRNLSDRERKRFEAERAKRIVRIRELMATRVWIDDVDLKADEVNETMKEQSLEEQKDEDEDSVAAKHYSRTIEICAENCQQEDKVTILSETSRNESADCSNDKVPSDSLLCAFQPMSSDSLHTMVEALSDCGPNDETILVATKQEAGHAASPEQDATIVTIPLGACELEALNVTSVKDDSTISSAAINEECLICLARFKGGDIVCESNNVACIHVFHSLCMEEWLMNHDVCPVCREIYLVEMVLGV